MRERFSSHAGRLFLLALGILLTSTAGHAAARMMAMQMAQGRRTFAFELAVMLAGMLMAAYFVAITGKRPLPAMASMEDGGAAAPQPLHSGGEASPVSAAQLTQLRLPPGLRLDSTEAILIATGTDRRVVFVNPAFARLTGHAARDWMGRSADLLAPEGLLRMESLLWLDTDPDGREAHWIARLHRGDGAQFCAEAHLHAVGARQGAATHVVLVMADVTSRIGSGKTREPAAKPMEQVWGIGLSARGS